MENGLVCQLEKTARPRAPTLGACGKNRNPVEKWHEVREQNVSLAVMAHASNHSIGETETRKSL